MQIHHFMSEPIRKTLSWEERWNGSDRGLISSWERGRELAVEDPDLADAAKMGQLVVLPFKGGVEKQLKIKRKIGTLFYLAMWHGLRGDDLCLNTDDEPEVTCSVSTVTVVFTGNSKKYANA